MRLPLTKVDCGCLIAQRFEDVSNRNVCVYTFRLHDYSSLPRRLLNNRNVKNLLLIDTREAWKQREQWEWAINPTNHKCPGKEVNNLERENAAKYQQMITPSIVGADGTEGRAGKMDAVSRAAHYSQTDAIFGTPQQPEQQPATPLAPPNGNRVPEPAPKTTEPLASGDDWKERQRIAKEKFEREKR